MMPNEKDAYLYARHQGEGDLASAEFVEWIKAHPKHEEAGLTAAYHSWRKEVDDLAMWEQQMGVNG